MSESPSTFNTYSIIEKKRDGAELTAEEINWFIRGLTQGDIPDYQAAALLMAIYIQGATKKETAALTDAMLYSGEVIKFNSPRTVDKHSTGGVGDKTSFVLGALASARGVQVPMIAGRGLGHTGGTVDKIESIAGFDTNCSLEEFKKMVLEDGICMIGQTEQIAPADKIIYALRDVTATIESIPLITASIMSKKLAEGASGLVMDIKTGNGAFMKTKSRARELAASLRDTALRFDRNIITSITDMSQPLGFTIGHSLEIRECIETLKGEGPEDLTELSVHLAGGMIHLAGLAEDLKTGKKMARSAIRDGSGLKSFKDMIQRQGGNPAVCDDYSLLPIAENHTAIVSNKSGYVDTIDTQGLGLACLEIGGGRKTKEDKIDFAVGLEFFKKRGDKIKVDEVIGTFYHHPGQQRKVDELVEHINSTILSVIPDKPKNIDPLIMETEISWSR